MFNRLLFKVKFRYLIFLFFFGIFINLNFLFISLSLVFLKLYLGYRRITYLVLFYTFTTFLIYELTNFNFLSEKNEYFTSSNIEYDINKNYGYFPKANSEFFEKIYFKEKLIKTNKYSINKYGHRKSIGSQTNSKQCIIFFGGSIIFGQSLNDNETLPHFVSMKFNGEKKVYNFAFNGYGPHQFLSKIENSYLNQLMKCEELTFVSFYIHDHIGRVVGKRSWGDKSPRYVINGEKLTQKGFFSSYPFKLIMKFRKNIRNSKIASIFFDVEKTNKKDQYIFIRILDEIEKKINSKYSNSNIYYIVWDKKNSVNQIVKNFFKSKKIIQIENLNIPSKYYSNNIPGDNHPTKEFNEILSKHIKNLIINNNVL